MTNVKIQRQIFLSFAPSDRRLAGQVADDLRRTGLTVVSMEDLGPGEYSDAVRRALTESDAVVTVLSGVSDRIGLPASVVFEIGAAVAAGKRIFLVTGMATFRLPFVASQLEILPINRIEEIASKLNENA
jgi:TIR domain